MFTALTFNMQNGEPWTGQEGENPPPNLEGTAAFLRAVAADVVLLQEVEQGRDGGGQREPPPNFERLQMLLDYPHSIFAYPPDNPDELPFGLGLAIFSRFELSDFAVVELPVPELSFEFGGRQRRPTARILLKAAARVKGRSLVLLNTHLQAFFMVGASSDSYPAQRRQVLEHFQKVGPWALLGGDLNTEPSDGLLSEFEAAGFRPVQKERATWKRQPYALDHLFPGAGLSVVESRVVETEASDHDAVWARLDFLS